MAVPIPGTGSDFRSRSDTPRGQSRVSPETVQRALAGAARSGTGGSIGNVSKDFSTRLQVAERVIKSKQVGRMENARMAMEEALSAVRPLTSDSSGVVSIIRGLQHPIVKVYMLLEIAKDLIESDRINEGERLLEEARSAVWQISNANDRVAVIELIKKTFVEIGRSEDAERLFPEVKKASEMTANFRPQKQTRREEGRALKEFYRLVKKEGRRKDAEQDGSTRWWRRVVKERDQVVAEMKDALSTIRSLGVDFDLILSTFSERHTASFKRYQREDKLAIWNVIDIQIRNVLGHLLLDEVEDLMKNDKVPEALIAFRDIQSSSKRAKIELSGERAKTIWKELLKKCEGFAKQGCVSLMLDLSKKLPSYLRADVLLSFATAWEQTASFFNTGTRSAICNISSPDLKAAILSHLLMLMLEVNPEENRPDTRNRLADILSVISKMKFAQERSHLQYTILDIVKIFVENGRLDEVLSAFSNIKNASERGIFIMKLIEVLITSDKLDEVESLLHDAQSTIPEIENANERGIFILKLIEVLITNDKLDDVEPLLHDAQSTIPEIENASEQDAMQLRIATAYLKIDKQTMGIAILNEYRESIMTRDAREKINGLLKIGKCYREARLLDEAVSALKAAESILEEINDPWQKTVWQRMIAIAYVKTGIFDEAELVTENIEIQSSAGRNEADIAWKWIAKGYVKEGNYEKAEKIYNDKIQGGIEKANFLLYYLSVHIRNQQKERAKATARLLTSIQPHDQEEFDHIHQIGQEMMKRFSEAYPQG